VSRRATTLYTPTYRQPPRLPQPGQPLWSFQIDEHTWYAELRDKGAVGGEGRSCAMGELVVGRRFDVRELATQWTEQEWQGIEPRLRE
jgi:hypothetical protein